MPREGDFDEDDFDTDNGDDHEVFCNTLIHLATRQIGLLFDRRVTDGRDKEDCDLVRLVEAVLQLFDEFLSPEQLDELWEDACAPYHEYRRGYRPQRQVSTKQGANAAIPSRTA
jgi:hypothetical protein